MGRPSLRVCSLQGSISVVHIEHVYRRRDISMITKIIDGYRRSPISLLIVLSGGGYVLLFEKSIPLVNLPTLCPGKNIPRSDISALRIISLGEHYVRLDCFSALECTTHTLVAAVFPLRISFQSIIANSTKAAARSPVVTTPIGYLFRSSSRLGFIRAARFTTT